MRDELLGYYERELIFLRRMGGEFARKYPKIATRLLLEEEKIEDPHVERMIEAFAFLAGRRPSCHVKRQRILGVGCCRHKSLHQNSRRISQFGIHGE